MGILHDLARQLSVLNDRVATLEARLAVEVRTARLVVVDDHGRERITTTTTHAATLLEINGPGPGAHGPEHASVHLEATANGSNWWDDDDEIARAAITLHSADDVFTSIEQVALTSRHVAQTIHEPASQSSGHGDDDAGRRGHPRSAPRSRTSGRDLEAALGRALDAREGERLWAGAESADARRGAMTVDERAAVAAAEADGQRWLDSL